MTIPSKFKVGGQEIKVENAKRCPGNSLGCTI